VHCALAQTSPLAVSFTQSAYEAWPSQGLALIGVTLSAVPSGPVIATLATVDGTAVAGVDYLAARTTLAWAANDPPLKIYAVPIAGTDPGNRSFTVSLLSVSGAEFGSSLDATVQIQFNPTAATGASSVSMSWSAPTQNTDGSALTDLAGYNIYYGPSPDWMSGKISLVGVGEQSYVIGSLSAGTWYFAVTAVNAAGIESQPTQPVAATI